VNDPGCRFVSFIDVTAVDYPGREKRFRRGLSLAVADAETRAFRLRAEASETTQVPSIIEVFPRRRLVRGASATTSMGVILHRSSGYCGGC